MADAAGEHRRLGVRTSAAFGVLKSGCTCLSYTDLSLVTLKNTELCGGGQVKAGLDEGQY